MKLLQKILFCLVLVAFFATALPVVAWAQNLPPSSVQSEAPESSSDPEESVSSAAEATPKTDGDAATPFFDSSKTLNLIGVLLLTGCILWFTARAKQGHSLFIRQIAGLSVLDEAVGRATEMGRPVLYIPGVGEIDDTQTMAALSVLGHVSNCTADYNIPIMVPNCSPVVMSMAQDAVSQAYLKAGCPDSYVSDYINYISGEQFSYAAGICGIMVREQPAAIMYMGSFLAEALMLAETGNTTGAIQISGTATASQLPFFVAACDYTLIGEELYAASAYLSNDPLQIGSLKGQDTAKALIMAVIVVGVILKSLGVI